MQALKSKEFSHIICRMFSDKERRLIKADIFHTIKYGKWSDFVLYKPYKMWLNFKPLMWNIDEENNIQILFFQNNTLLNLKEIIINVSDEDEPAVLKWVSEHF